MKLKLTTKLLLIAVILLAALFRFYGLNWDQGYYLHPDERAIIMTVSSLSWPQNISEFLSVTSPWNTHFFAYGSLPFYLLHTVGQLLSNINPNFTHYGYLHFPGRSISAISDLLTLFVLFLLGRKLFNEKVGLIAAFFYAVSVLPIQLSHFYAVDTLLTFFILTILYQLVLFYEKPTIKRGVVVGFLFGIALATKVSALVLVVAIGASLAADFLLLFLKQPHKPHYYLPHIPKFLKRLIGYAFVIFCTTVVTFIFFEPYALIDFQTFWLQTMQQQAMTRDAFTFPYTLQYVNKVPYAYELKNIFLYGLGPLLAALASAGILYMTIHIIKKDKQEKWAQETILLIFFAAYFITVGSFAIGFMRYMLPLYPLLCLFAATIGYQLFKIIQNKNHTVAILCSLLFALCSLIWPLSFVQIYHHNNTRVDATDWINQHIPYGSAILVEHWDDRLPLRNSENYVIEDLELYNTDSPEKWQKITDQLQQAEYIIIASNRLYTPLPKLTDCTNLPQHRCYPETAKYYENLFSGKNVILNSFQDPQEMPKHHEGALQVRHDNQEVKFQKIAEFERRPKIPFTNITINDQNADESFTVYDHPKVMIFKKY